MGRACFMSILTLLLVTPRFVAGVRRRKRTAGAETQQQLSLQQSQQSVGALLADTVEASALLAQKQQIQALQSSIEKAQQDYTNSQHRYEAVEEDLQDQVRRYRHQLSRLHLFQSLPVAKEMHDTAIQKYIDEFNAPV
eukprot:INCI5246.2.p2 GENE.INCI5246.2~~INCI5246.2.p2  ORF type:complete len:138 (-),score=30.98 INCI5246.2:73-486(-)